MSIGGMGDGHFVFSQVSRPAHALNDKVFWQRCTPRKSTFVCA